MWLAPCALCGHRIIVAEEDEWAIEWIWLSHAMEAHPDDQRVRFVLALPWLLASIARDVQTISVYRAHDHETWGITVHNYDLLPADAVLEAMFAAAVG